MRASASRASSTATTQCGFPTVTAEYSTSRPSPVVRRRFRTSPLSPRTGTAAASKLARPISTATRRPSPDTEHSTSPPGVPRRNRSVPSARPRSRR